MVHAPRKRCFPAAEGNSVAVSPRRRSQDALALLADVGATNARFAVLDEDGSVQRTRVTPHTFVTSPKRTTLPFKPESE
jgi:hypothetical protein